jgi:hypothetical protein
MSGGQTFIYGDFGFMPAQDLYGNNVVDAGYKPVSTITLSSSPDLGRLRIDHSVSMENAGINATNHAARRIRNNETVASQLDTVIYSIGLGGVDAAEDELLNRVSNTQASPVYDAGRPEGLYVYAPTTAQLNEAFARIAGEILRIAK